MSVLTLEKATLHSIAKDIDLWCEKSEDLHRYLYVLGPFDGLNSHLIQELLNILSEKKQLKVSHLHIFLHSNIKHLDFSVCTSLVSDQVLGIVGYRCKKLTQLSLKHCMRLSTKALKEISKSLPLLQSIDLSGCTACTDNVLDNLGHFCPQLRILKADSCSQVSDAGVDALCGDEKNPKCRVLREVNLASTAVTNTGLCKILSTQSELLKLSMASSEACLVSSTHLRTTRLNSVDFSYTAITDSSIKSLCEVCPLLSELSLNCCNSITEVSLQYIASLKHLKSLSIAGNLDIKFQPDFMQFLQSSGALLQTLNISGMESVDTEILGTHCGSLGCLVMTDCVDLCGNFIRVAGDEDNWLSLAKACPHLKFLNLHGCQFSDYKPITEHLVAIVSGSVNLNELDLSGIEKLEDKVIQQFVQSSILSLLSSVNLSRCSDITVESIEPLVSVCKSLTQLNLSHCRSISLQDAKNLRKMCKEVGYRVKIIWV